MVPERPSFLRSSLRLLFGMPRQIWSHRDLIAQMTLREVGQRYRGTFLGIIWSFLMPLLMLMVYTVVFSVILPSRWPNSADSGSLAGFSLTLFAGLIPFTVFSEVTMRAPVLVLNVPNYVKRVVFPLEILPVVALSSALINSLIAIVVLLLGSLIFRGSICPLIVLLPLMYVPLILLCLGLAWFLASLGVYIRDVGHLIGFILQMLFFISPVFYPVTSVPKWLQPVMHLNPLTAILEGFRYALLGMDGMPWAVWSQWAAGAALLAILGYVFFMKTKSGFADVL
jgi:lipopolysaccharide transport system permease protein